MWTHLSRTPIALLELINNKARLAVAIVGVAFASLLMFLEMGFLNGLFDSQTNVVERLNADLLLMNRQKEAVVPKIPFPRVRLTQALAHPDVAAGYPVYAEDLRSVWKNPTNHKERALLVYAFNPDDPVFLIPEVIAQAAELKKPDTALIDTRGKDIYGDRVPGSQGELTRHSVQIVGTFPLGPDFRVDGNLIVSDRTFFRCFQPPPPDAAEHEGPGPERPAITSRIEFGLLKLVPGANARSVRDALRRDLPDDVQVMTKQEFIQQVRHYWATSQPVGYVFGMGMVVGFLIGVTICYQILYTDVMDHLPQFAMLKAIGYSNAFLKRVVLQEAVLLGCVGFVPGWLCSIAAYRALQGISGVRMELNVWRVALVFVLTVIMCAVSGLIAVRKAVRSDPTEVF